MPTIHKRFLVQMLLALALFAGALTAVHAVQSRRIPDALRRQSDRAAEANKPDAAIKYLRQYLEFRPDDVDVQERLAELLRDRAGEAARADLVFLYDRILRADPNRTAVRREALALCLRYGRYTDAAAHAEALLKVAPQETALWQQLAAAQAGMRQFDEARRSYETAVTHAPGELLGYQRLAQFLWRDIKQPADAKAVVDRMVLALPKNPEAYLTRARFTVATEEEAPLLPLAKDPVLLDVDRALALTPHLAEALLVKAERLQRHRDISGAQACLSDGLRHHPGDLRLVRSLAWLEASRGNTAGAIGVLDDALPHSGENGLDLLVPLADLLVQAGDVSRIDDIIKNLDRRRGAIQKMQAKYLRGRLAMRQEQWDAAIGHLTTLRTDAAAMPGLEAQANLLLSTCYRHKGDTDQEVECLKRIASKDPTNLSARVALGQAYIAAGSTDDAIREYEAAVQSPFASSSVFNTYVRLQALGFVAKQPPAEAWRGINKLIAELAARFGPNSSEPALLAAEVALIAGTPATAVDILKREVGRRPRTVQLWAALADAVAEASGVAAGLMILDEAQGFVPDSADLRLARADLYARDPAKLRPLALLETGTAAWTDAEQMKLLHGLVDIYDRIGESALHLWKRIAARRPNDVEVWLALAARNPDAATRAEAVAAVTKSEPNSLCLLQALSASTPADRVACISAVAKQYGDTPQRSDACLTLARLQRDQGNVEKANALFLRACQLDPNRLEPTAAYLSRLGGIDRDAEAKILLARLATDPRWAGEPFRRVVRRAAEMAGPQTGPRLLNNARHYTSNHPGWIADAELAFGNKDAAIALMKEAVQRQAATADDWLRLVLTTGDLQLLATAKSKLSIDNYAAVIAALTLAGQRVPEAGTPADARALNRAILALHQTRGDRDQAVALLEAYLKRETPPADAAWATRHLAMLLVVRGEPADRTRAVALLAGDAATDAGSIIDDKRATAAVLSSLHRYLDGADRNAVLTRAIVVMADVARDSGAPKDAFALVSLYKAAGDADAAVARLRTLLNADPGNIDYLLAGLDVLIESKQYPAARGFADRLLALAAADYRVVAAVARYECLSGRPATAAALAEGYMRTADPLAGDVPAKAARTAELLDELARMPGVLPAPEGQAMIDAAIRRYEMLLPQSTEVVVAIAGLLATADRTAEAFAQIEKHARIIPATIKIAAGVNALRTGKGTPAHYALVERWLEAANVAEPDAIATKLLIAEYRTLRQDYTAAEAIYTDVLKRDPRNVTALNNLAWLLAPNPAASSRALELIDRAVKETGLTGELLDTRARVRIAANQKGLATSDAAEALKQDKTPLRYFHLALAMKDANPSAAATAFREAKDRGLASKTVHPADLAAYQAFEKTDH